MGDATAIRALAGEVARSAGASGTPPTRYPRKVGQQRTVVDAAVESLSVQLAIFGVGWRLWGRDAGRFAFTDRTDGIETEYGLLGRSELWLHQDGDLLAVRLVEDRVAPAFEAQAPRVIDVGLATDDDLRDLDFAFRIVPAEGGHLWERVAEPDTAEPFGGVRRALERLRDEGATWRPPTGEGAAWA